MNIFDVTLDVSSHQTVFVSDQSKSLFLKWKESGDDEDFEAVAMSIEDDVKEQIEFWIENIRIVEQGVSKS